MKYDCKQHQSDAMEPANTTLYGPAYSQSEIETSAIEILAEDDRYPGTFFRIPGVPVPGKTTWTLSK